MALIVSLLIATASHAGEVTGFTLIDTRNNRDIGPLEDGGAFDRPIIGSAGNLRANVSGRGHSSRPQVGGDKRNLGQPPSAQSEDWVVFVRQE